MLNNGKCEYGCIPDWIICHSWLDGRRVCEYKYDDYCYRGWHFKSRAKFEEAQKRKTEGEKEKRSREPSVEIVASSQPPPKRQKTERSASPEKDSDASQEAKALQTPRQAEKSDERKESPESNDSRKDGGATSKAAAETERRTKIPQDWGKMRVRGISRSIASRSPPPRARPPPPEALRRTLDARIDAIKEANMALLHLRPKDNIPSRKDLEQAFRDAILGNGDRDHEKDIVEAFQWLQQKRGGIRWPSLASDAPR